MRNIIIAIFLSGLLLGGLVLGAFINAMSDDGRINFQDKEKFIIYNNPNYNPNFAPNDYGAQAFVQDGKIFYSNSGSSTCPPVIQKVKKVRQNHYKIFVKQYGKRACTMDMRPVSQIVEKEQGEFSSNDVIEIINQPRVYKDHERQIDPTPETPNEQNKENPTDKEEIAPSSPPSTSNPNAPDEKKKDDMNKESSKVDNND